MLFGSRGGHEEIAFLKGDGVEHRAVCSGDDLCANLAPFDDKAGIECQGDAALLDVCVANGPFPEVLGDLVAIDDSIAGVQCSDRNGWRRLDGADRSVANAALCPG